VDRIVTALLAMSLSGCAHQSASLSPNARGAAARVDTVINRFAQLNASPGFGVVVVRDTQILYMRGVGYADVEKQLPFTPNTEFYIASTTKSFTGLAAAILAQRGVWDLDAPLSRYLPAVPLKKPLDADSITIRALLTHTHGIASGPVDMRLAYTGEYDGDAELIRLLAEHSAANTGRAFAYSNLGYNIAALAMDNVTHKSWKEVLQELLFTPLGMRNTSAYISHFAREQIATPYRTTPTGFSPTYLGKTDANMQSAGGLVTTLNDMATWLEMHINNGRLNGRVVLPEAAVRETHKYLVPASSRGRPWTEIGYGLGWQIALAGTDTLLVHGGGFTGYATHMSFMPQQRIGVAVFANNSELGGGLVDLIAAAAYNAVLGRPLMSSDSVAALQTVVARVHAQIGAELARRATRPQTLPYPLSAYVGRYHNPQLGTVRITEKDGRLEAWFGAAWSPIEVYDATKNQLRVEPFGNGEVVTVGMDEGHAETLTIGPLTFTRVE